MGDLDNKYEEIDLWISKSGESDKDKLVIKSPSGSQELKEDTSQEIGKYASDNEFPNIFRFRDVVLNENWDSIETFSSRVLHVDQNYVHCECLLNSEDRIFEEHTFAMELFKHIFPVEIYKPILIKISTKAGSSRIDVFDGKGLVDESIFNLKDGWEELRNTGLDKPFKI